MEELMFRGYAMQRAMRGIGVPAGLAVFGVLFCVAHPLDGSMSAGMMVLAMANTFLFAVSMGVVWMRTGSLAVPIGWHMGWNWAQQVLGFGVSGIATHGLWTPVFTGAPDWLTGGAYGLEASLVDTVLSTAILLALVAWRPRPRLPAAGVSAAVPA
jgi:membrane protease YdiL (CAAX protease family)